MALKDYIETKPVIETERLRLRPMVVSDIPSLKEWMGDPSLYPYWGMRPGKTDKQPELLFAKAETPTKTFHLGIEERSCGKVIGELWIRGIENDRMATVSIRLAALVHNKGYGTEALLAMTKFCFAHTELKRLQAEIDVRNLPSQRIFEKCGYQREGRIRQGKMVSSWCDYYIYGILASDPMPD